MNECKFVASRKVDADVKKHTTALMRAATKHGAMVARRKIEADDFKAGVVAPESAVDAFVAELRTKGWTVKFATPRPEPQEQAPEKQAEPAGQAEPGERLPHPLISETREARLGCAWGSSEMESIAQSIGMNTSQLAHLADSPGHAFGHFRFDPWKLWHHLGGRTLVSMRNPEPKTADVLKLFAKKYGTECEAYKFYRLQSVGFRPELLKKGGAK